MSGSEAFTRAYSGNSPGRSPCSPPAPIIMAHEGDRFIQTPVHDLTTVSSHRRRILTTHITVRRRYLRYVSTDHDGVEGQKKKKKNRIHFIGIDFASLSLSISVLTVDSSLLSLSKSGIPKSGIQKDGISVPRLRDGGHIGFAFMFALSYSAVYHTMS
jgi:hypothetical protein